MAHPLLKLRLPLVELGLAHEGAIAGEALLKLEDALFFLFQGRLGLGIFFLEGGEGLLAQLALLDDPLHIDVTDGDGFGGGQGGANDG